MSVCRAFFASAAWLCVCGLLAGCGDRGGAPLTPETDDPYYVQGVQWKRQNRNPEALTSFLKVIDKRGERGSPESHLQVGEIYLNQIKEPVYAYYHFKRYLELQPNSPQAELVRGMVKAALREFAKTLPGRPLDEQNVRVQADDDVMRLRKENEQLRAELAVLRGGGAAPLKPAPQMITVADARTPPPIVPTTTVTDAAAAAPPVIRPAPGPMPLNQPGTNVGRVAPVTPSRTTATPTARPDTTTRLPPPSGGRTHTVAPKETLFSLSKRYGVTIEEIVAANGMPSATAPLKIGAVLRIPGPAANRR